MKNVVSLSEDDVCSLLQKYSAAAILCVLGEIARYPKVELNWDDIVSSTCSGITSASHLHLLWRHLAYRLPLDNPHSLDYDSDLDLHLLPLPDDPDSSLASSCVTLLATGAAAAAPEIVDLDSTPDPDPNPDPNSSSRRKRKWTHDEDSNLIASVLKWGEGNWVPISKDSRFPRSPAQLSQRWAHLRKRQGSTVSLATPQLSEAQLATRRAINMALKDNLPLVGNGAPVINNPVKTKPSSGESPTTTISVPPQRPPPQAANATASTAAPSSTVPTPKPRSGVKKVPPKPPSISSTIQRTAVASGARIVNPSDAKPVHNFANVRFFRTGVSGSTVSVGAGLPKAKTISAVSGSASAIDGPQKKEDNASGTKQTMKVQKSNASLPQSPPKAQPVNTQSAISKGLTPREDNNGKLELFTCSTAGGSNEKMESSTDGLKEAKSYQTD